MVFPSGLGGAQGNGLVGNALERIFWVAIMGPQKRDTRRSTDLWDVSSYLLAVVAVSRLLRRGRPLAAQTVGVAAVVGCLGTRHPRGLWIGLAYGFGRVAPPTRLPLALAAGVFALHGSRTRGWRGDVGWSLMAAVSAGVAVRVCEKFTMGRRSPSRVCQRPRVVIVANVDSGSTRLFRRARRMLDAKRDGGTEVVLVKAGDLCAAIDAATKLVGPAGRVIAAGGDGTIGAAIAKIAVTDTELGILPTGTGNDIARSLAIPLYPEEAALAASGAASREVDMLSTNLGVAVHALSVGLVADFAQRVQNIHGWRRPLLYPVVALATWHGRRSVDLEVLVNGHATTERYLNVAVVNAPRIGGRVGITLPSGAPDDGVAQLVMISRAAWRIAIGEIGSLFRQRARRVPRRAMIEEVTELQLRATHPFIVALDGEPRGPVSQLMVELIPKACRVAAPTPRKQ
ncbi:diacylglycerol kinase family protein [Ferrimicrobium sp.]|uniref:diacylglycerol/lipid kinase family protein n=1 Tax=Ferrimicrobium sp. TaxID=2926050 RepID=UPI002633C466|nr:diacylglycerol kinase family protein [Ferrimicrobium sp.]